MDVGQLQNIIHTYVHTLIHNKGQVTLANHTYTTTPTQPHTTAPSKLRINPGTLEQSARNTFYLKHVTTHKKNIVCAIASVFTLDVFNT